MLHTPDRRQLAAEADAITRLNAANRDPQATPVAPDIVVLSHPAEVFRPPPFLVKTATPELVAELRGLFQELWTLNEDHVGERVLEVVAYYSVTNLAGDLQDRFRAWADRYFRLRADPRNLNPGVRNDPFLLFEKLVDECDAVFGGLGSCDDSVCVIVLGVLMDYVPWLLYTLLWRDLVVPHETGFGLRYEPAAEHIPSRMADWLLQKRWHEDRLSSFLGNIARNAGRKALDRLANLPDDRLRGRLAGMAADIQEMRPFLLRNFRPYKTALELGPGLVVAYTWGHRQGIANLCVGATAEEVRVRAERFQSKEPIGVDHIGRLIDFRMPWLTADGCTTSEGVRPLILNCMLLERFHDRLLRFYDQIDFAQLRQTDRPEGLGPEETQEAVAVACRDMADREPAAHDEPIPAEAEDGRRIRPLRALQLFRVLAERLGCEVRPGKGSEVVLYRPGGRLFTVGRHRRNDAVNPILVQRILGRLGIGLQEWLAAVR